MKEFLNNFGIWANNNQGIVAVILFALGGVGALVFRNKSMKKFTQKGGKNSKNYQAENMTINGHE